MDAITSSLYEALALAIPKLAPDSPERRIAERVVAECRGILQAEAGKPDFRRLDYAARLAAKNAMDFLLCGKCLRANAEGGCQGCQYHNMEPHCSIYVEGLEDFARWLLEPYGK